MAGSHPASAPQRTSAVAAALTSVATLTGTPKAACDGAGQAHVLPARDGRGQLVPVLPRYADGRDADGSEAVAPY